MEKEKEMLTAALKAGDYAEALSIVVKFNHLDAAELLLKTGFSLTRIDNQREFWNEVQLKVAFACRHKVDGWGMRRLRLQE